MSILSWWIEGYNYENGREEIDCSVANFASKARWEGARCGVIGTTSEYGTSSV